MIFYLPSVVILVVPMILCPAWYQYGKTLPTGYRWIFDPDNNQFKLLDYQDKRIATVYKYTYETWTSTLVSPGYGESAAKSMRKTVRTWKIAGCPEPK